jgi:hypothetical protein
MRGWAGRGLGQGETLQQEQANQAGFQQSASEIAGGISAALSAALGAATGGAVSAGGGGGGAPGTGGAVSAGINAIATAITGVIKGCGPTCTYTSNLANQIEALMQQNLSAYLALPAPRSSADQAQAQANFNTLWQTLVNSCSVPNLGSAGANCLIDREDGACSYKTTPGGWQQNASGAWTYQYPGANGSGSSCWNWFIGYLDPIINDPTAGAASAFSAVTSQVGTEAGAQGGISTGLSAIPWWVWALGIGAIAWVALK